MNGKRNLTAVLRKDRISRLIFGGLVMDGVLLISLLALAISLVR